MNEVKFKANIKDLVAIQAAVSEIPEIPAPTVANEGKVLTVSIDSSGETPVAEYGLAAPASGLPAIGSGDAGKVLTVNAGETAAEWASAAGGGMTVYNIYYSFEVTQDATYLLTQLPELTGTLYYYISTGTYQPYKDASLTQEYSLSEFTALIDAMRQGTALVFLHEMSESEWFVNMATSSYVDTDWHTPPVEHDHIDYSIGEPINDGDAIGYTIEVKDGNA